MNEAGRDIANACPELDIVIEPVKEPYAASFDEQINVLIEEMIPVFSFTFGTLEPVLISRFTMLIRAFSGRLARGVRNQFTERMQEMNALILDYPVQNTLTGSMRKKAKEIDNIEFMSLWAGQSTTLCRNISAGELVNLLMREMG